MTELWNSIERFFSYIFRSGSSQASDINTLFLQFTILAGVIVAIVAGWVFYSAYRYRRKKHPQEPSQTEGNFKLEITWTVIPFLILVFFFYLTVKSMKDINRPPGNKKPDIRIIAHQWWWDMRYPDSDVITANELHIPVGKRLLMEIESADVIHSWWVPALGRKTDAVPGRQNYGWIEADSAGVYLGKCSEYCGTEHAWMLIQVVAEPQEEFDKWIKHQQSIPSPPKDSLAREGEVIFLKKACASCHTIRGTFADAHVAPDLTHFGSRKIMLSGMYKNNRENLRNWLLHTQKMKPGSDMPNFMLTQKEVDALVTFLEGLK